MSKNNQLLFIATDEHYDLDSVIQVSKKPQKTDQPDKRPKSQFYLWLLLQVVFVCFVTRHISNEVSTFEEVSIQKEDGTYTLSPERQAKLDRELTQLDNAEQYALIAMANGWYPCYHCRDADSIYLFVEEIWRYGVTTKGQRGRYPSGLPHQDLAYFTEFEGDLLACLKREKTQIYNYINLPENLKRTNRLIRPPGNKQDN